MGEVYHGDNESFTMYPFEALVRLDMANETRFNEEEMAKMLTADDPTKNLHASRMTAIKERGKKIKAAMLLAQPTPPLTPVGTSQNTGNTHGLYQPGNNSDRMSYQNKIQNAIKDIPTFNGGADVHRFITAVEVKKDLICNAVDLQQRQDWLPDLFLAAIKSTLLDTSVLIQMRQAGATLATFDELKSQLETTYGADESIYQRWSNFNASQPHHQEDFQAFCSRMHGATEDLKRNIMATFKKNKLRDMNSEDIWQALGAFVVGSYLQQQGETALGINHQVVATSLGTCVDALEIGKVVKNHMQACSLQPRVQVNRTIDGGNNSGRIHVDKQGIRTYNPSHKRGHPNNPNYFGNKFDPNYRNQNKKQSGKGPDRDVSFKADRKKEPRSPDKSPRRNKTKQAKVAKQAGYTREVTVDDMDDSPL